MKIVSFFVSTSGDTNLALATIKSLETRDNEEQHKVLLVALTKTAQDGIQNFQSPLLIEKKSLTELLNIPNFPTENKCSNEQINTIVRYAQETHKANYAVIGVPSTAEPTNETPFQLAGALENIPVLIAYEFMYKSESNYLWKHLSALKQKPYIQWGIPLSTAIEDMGPDAKVHITGHLSIDNACLAKVPEEASLGKIRMDLKVEPEHSLAFLSSTTQPAEVDAAFLNCLLEELPNYPQIQLRLGLHPGIQDLDGYLAKILAVYKEHPKAAEQFKIILPDRLVCRIKIPELTINNPLYKEVFITKTNLTGADAATAAERVAQPVLGALSSQAAMEGKPAFSLGKLYLPEKSFAKSAASFFAAERQAPLTRKELGLNEKTAGENYADIILYGAVKA